MKIIYWTVVWFGLDIIEKAVCLHYTGLESCRVFSDEVEGLAAFVMIGIWVAGCIYFAKDE